MAPRKGMTFEEIAAQYKRSPATVRNTWARHPDWPTPIDRRGRAHEYDPAEVDRVVYAHFVRAAPEERGEPDDLLAQREIADYLGVSYGAVRSMVSRGVLGEPDATEGGSKLWRRATVQERRAHGRKRKGKPAD